MKNRLTSIMYHYILPMKYSRYPNLKALDLDLFKEQLAYLKKHYYFPTVHEVVYSIENNIKMPGNSMLLTFDDGYKCHYDYVFPLLSESNIQGLFFPSAMPINEGKMLDINKIHLLLEHAESDMNKLSDKLLDLIGVYKNTFDLRDKDFYIKKCAEEIDRYDTPQVLFIKRMLQVVLPEKAREFFISRLMETFLDVDEKILCHEFYMSIDQLKVMKSNGMVIGSHGDKHIWLGKSDTVLQDKEISASVDLLKKVGVPKNKYTFCYPSGDYDLRLIGKLSLAGYKLGFTVDRGISNLDAKSSLVLKRLDYPDLPYDRNSEANEWTREVL